MRKILVSLMVIAMAVALISGGTLAYFTDNADSQTNSFKAGTLSIVNTGVTESADISMLNMAPGDVTDEVVLTIINDGSLNLGWVGDWQFSGGAGTGYDLKDALYVNSARMEFISPSGISWVDDTTVGYEADGDDWFIKDGIGHGPYATAINGLAGLPFGLISLNRFNDNTTMGVAPNEHKGAMKPGYGYRLHVVFGFAAGADNNYQGLGPVTAKLVVKATQIDDAAFEALGVSEPDITWMNNQITDQTE